MTGDFKWRHFVGEIILWAVRWYCKYGISYRELEEMMEERGVDLDHTTLYRWVQHYAPEIEKRLRWAWRRSTWTGRWHVDETYIKVRGRWVYLYRAVDEQGQTIDFYLSQTRNTKAASRFLSKALNGFKEGERPCVIHTDRAPTYGKAIASLKREGKLPDRTEHRQIKYHNNVIEADHGKLKRRIKPTLGFKSMKTAYATIKGFELMHALRKGQARLWLLSAGIRGEVRLVERAFGLGPSILTEAMQQLQAAFA
jgi:transposase-like protein